MYSLHISLSLIIILNNIFVYKSIIGTVILIIIMLFVITMFEPDQVDYVGIASGTRLLTFVAGQTTEQTVNIAIIDDTLIEATEAFNVQANSNDGRVTINGSPNGFVVANIIDDDASELH